MENLRFDFDNEKNFEIRFCKQMPQVYISFHFISFYFQLFKHCSLFSNGDLNGVMHPK